MEEFNTREGLLEVVRRLRAVLDQDIAEAGVERIVEPGSFDELSFKDVIAHMTGWRLLSAARLEAGLSDEEPVFPWPDHLSEEEDLHAINHWFYETNLDKPLDQVLRESNETFERVERAIAMMQEEALLTPGRFDWISWTDHGLGPAVVRGMFSHYHVDHEPDIRAWLAKGSESVSDT